MIFSFLREELQRPGQAFALIDGPRQIVVAEIHIKKIGLPSQLRRRMGVGIGDQLKGVQRRDPPVHRRVRRKPRLQSMDMGSQISEAVLNPVKTGKSAEQGEVGRPDMRGHINRLRAGLQHNFQQVPAVQP